MAKRRARARQTEAEIVSAVVDGIQEALAAGTVPWQSGWAMAGDPRSHHNPQTGATYRGVNRFNLHLVAAHHGYTTQDASGEEVPESRWLGYQGAIALGGHVRKGERGTPGIYWDKRVATSVNPADITPDNPDGTTTRQWMVPRPFRVFNVAQCDGLTLPPLPGASAPTWEPIAECERVADGYARRESITVRHIANPRAPSYQPISDVVTMPYRDLWESAEQYHGTMFHELAHASGAVDRLNRPGVTGGADLGADGDGTTQYGREELVAEISAASLLQSCGVEAAKGSRGYIENAAAYCQGWAKAIATDHRIILRAAAQAERVVAHIRPELGKGEE